MFSKHDTREAVPDPENSKRGAKKHEIYKAVRSEIIFYMPGGGGAWGMAPLRATPDPLLGGNYNIRFKKNAYRQCLGAAWALI